MMPIVACPEVPIVQPARFALVNVPPLLVLLLQPPAVKETVQLVELGFVLGHGARDVRQRLVDQRAQLLHRLLTPIVLAVPLLARMWMRWG
jgi:hypothetical protein